MEEMVIRAGMKEKSLDNGELLPLQASLLLFQPWGRHILYFSYNVDIYISAFR